MCMYVLYIDMIDIMMSVFQGLHEIVGVKCGFEACGLPRIATTIEH